MVGDDKKVACVVVDTKGEIRTTVLGASHTTIGGIDHNGVYREWSGTCIPTLSSWAAELGFKVTSIEISKQKLVANKDKHVTMSL